MNKFKFYLVLLLLFSLSSCSYIKQKKDQWFGDNEPEYIAPVVEVVEEPSEDISESTETEQPVE